MARQKDDTAILAEIRRVMKDTGNWMLKADTPLNKRRALHIIDDLVRRREGPLTRDYRASKRDNAKWNAARRAEGWKLVNGA